MKQYGGKLYTRACGVANLGLKTGSPAPKKIVYAGLRLMKKSDYF